MILYLIKNNLKMMLRNKWIALVLVVGPVLTVAILSNAFEELLRSYEGVEAFSVGYQLSGESELGNSMESVKEIALENDIHMTEYPEGEPKELMQKNGLAGFVLFEKERYVLYKSEEYMVEGITMEYFISKMMNQISGMGLANLHLRIPESAEGTALPSGQGIADMALEDVELPITSLSFMPAIDAKDYYGIVYIVYFIWCGIACLSPILASEQKNGISNRFRVSAVSDAGVYLARWISVSIVQIVGTIAAVWICVALFGITWGNIFWSAVILLLSILAANAFSLMIYYIFRNLAITIVVVWTMVWFMGFAGGSFETYMLSSMEQWIKELSPIYYINRTLVEYSCMGSSDYTQSCIVYLLVLLVLCSVGAVFVERIRQKGMGR